MGKSWHQAVPLPRDQRRGSSWSCARGRRLKAVTLDGLGATSTTEELWVFKVHTDLRLQARSRPIASVLTTTFVQTAGLDRDMPATGSQKDFAAAIVNNIKGASNLPRSKSATIAGLVFPSQQVQPCVSLGPHPQAPSTDESPFPDGE